MYKKCAICYGKLLHSKMDICTNCYKRWGRKELWIIALIKIEQRNNYVDREEYNLTRFTPIIHSVK